MAFDIGDLGNDSGYVYARLKTGAINTLPNTPNQVMNIMLDAVRSRLIYTKYTEETGGSFTDQFQDNDWGTRYYLNAEPTAPVGNLTGALDITKYVIDAQKCYKDNLTISAGELTIVRYSFFHLLIISPETGTTDVLNYLNHDLQPGDLVFITLADDANDTVTIQSSSVDGGNFKVQNNQDIILHGPGSCAMFVRDGSNAQLAGGKGYLREIGRPNQQALGVANKTLTPAGGTYYILDESTPDAARIDTKRGFVILHGNGNTLSAPWNIFGESVDTAISQGTTLEIVMDSPLYTDVSLGRSLNIFGIEIPDIYAKNYNFIVKAWYDADNTEWVARMYVDQIKEGWVSLITPVGSGEDGPIFTANTSVVDDTSPAYAIRTITHNENTIANVRFYGQLISAITEVGGGVGTPEVLASFGIAGWIPNQNIGAGRSFFVCPFYDPADLSVVVGLVGVMIDTAIRIKVLAGFTLNVGDYVDVSSISYIAEIS